jgi:hypothetical protein
MSGVCSMNDRYQKFLRKFLPKTWREQTSRKTYVSSDDNIKWDLKTEWYGAELIWPRIKTSVKLLWTRRRTIGFYKRRGGFLRSPATGGFMRRTSFHGVIKQSQYKSKCCQLRISKQQTFIVSWWLGSSAESGSPPCSFAAVVLLATGK